MRVYINPETGEFEMPPAAEDAALDDAAAGELPGQLQGAGGTPLEEVESPSPEYGVGIRLNGRFQSNIVATAGVDGKVQTECNQPRPAENAD